MPASTIRTTTTIASLSVICLALLAGCHGFTGDTGAAAGSDQIASTINGNVAAMVAAYNAHDADRAVAFDTADYVGMMQDNENLAGPAADLAMDKVQMADPAIKLSASNGTVDIAKGGDMAVWRGTYGFTYTDPKTKAVTSERGNWLTGWKLQPDGTWKTNWSIIAKLPGGK